MPRVGGPAPPIDGRVSLVPSGGRRETRFGPASRGLKVPPTLRYAAAMAGQTSRPLLSAEMLSIGSELTVGETRDTNAAELARSLTQAGVRVRRLQALPDDLAAVSDAFRVALDRADLVVSTGGLGPTPDDLTREAIATACAEVPTVDPVTEAWLHELWARRGIPFPAMNLKQAWLIPSATAIPNANGTAPGWWVDRPDGRVIVALPGPPREMRPMWLEWVLPRLRAGSLGEDVAQVTYRLAGIGESVVADVLSEAFLRTPNPVVATYARQDAVDVRISAHGEDGTPAAELVEVAAGIVRTKLAEHIWATGETTWGEAIGGALAARRWTLATLEVGTAGAFAHLLGPLPGLLSAEVRAALTSTLVDAARALRAAASADVALVVRARLRAGDTAVRAVVVTPNGTHRESRLAFLGGAQGRHRAALAAADILLRRIRPD